GVLPGNDERITRRSGSGVVGTRYVHWLPALQCAAPDDAPATNDRVGHSFSRRHEVLALAEGQLIRSAQMYNIANVERRVAVVGFDADDAGGPVIGAAHAALIQQINGIASYLGVGVCRQKTQAIRKSLFRLGLKSMVVTAACRGRQITLTREIGEWNHTLCVPVRGQDLQDVVVLREYLQMACKCCYVARLDRQRRSDGILQSKVTLHGIGCVEVELNALKGQSLCVYSERIG